MGNSFCINESKLVGILNRGENNPRNSEGSFLKLADGRIAFVFSRFIGDSCWDHAPCDICVVYSIDNGESFDTENIETVISAKEFKLNNVMGVTMRYMNNGDIGLFYMLKHSGLSSEYRLRRFDKDFKRVLSDIKCFPTGYDSYFVVNNDRVLKTSKGKWIIPAAFHHSGMAPEQNYFDYHGSAFFFSSDDDGMTWNQHHNKLYLADNHSKSGLQEPGIVELPNGVLYAYARTDRMAQYEAISIDGGENWFGPQPSRFTSPESPMLIKNNPYSGKYYAIWNPTPICPDNPWNSVTLGRNPFVIAQSLDGINFSEPIFIENDSSKGYCYPAIYFLDEKTMLVSYCNGGAEEGLCLNRTVIRKIILD